MIREGPINCYWCSEPIPYTISDIYWYCWNCRRYTRNSQIGEELKEHFCGRRKILSPENKVVMSQCTSESIYICPVPLITLTQFDYQEDLLKRERKNSYHTREWYYKVQTSIEEHKKIQAIKRERFVSSHPVLANPESVEYKTSFAKFEARELRKAERRKAKRNSR